MQIHAPDCTVHWFAICNCTNRVFNTRPSPARVAKQIAQLETLEVPPPPLTEADIRRIVREEIEKGVKG